MIKIVQHRQFGGEIKSCTVSKTPTNKYYISILVDEDIKQLPKSNNKVGIDLGITDFAITSDGEVFENPKWLRKSERRLAKLQRDLSRKKKGSNNRNKARLKVAKLHEKDSQSKKRFSAQIIF